MLGKQSAVIQRCRQHRDREASERREERPGEVMRRGNASCCGWMFHEWRTDDKSEWQANAAVDCARTASPLRALFRRCFPPPGLKNSTVPAFHLSARTSGTFLRAASHRCAKQSRTEVGFSPLAHLLVHQTASHWAGKNNSHKNYLCQKISGAVNPIVAAVPQRTSVFLFYSREKIRKCEREETAGYYSDYIASFGS